MQYNGLKCKKKPGFNIETGFLIMSVQSPR